MLLVVLRVEALERVFHADALSDLDDGSLGNLFAVAETSENDHSDVPEEFDESDQTFRIDAEFPDSLSMQFVHITVESNIMIQEKKNTLVIPRKLLMKGDSVNIKNNGNATIIPVKTGILTLDDAEIVSGLDENAELIVPTEK